MIYMFGGKQSGAHLHTAGPAPRGASLKPLSRCRPCSACLRDQERTARKRHVAAQSNTMCAKFGLIPYFNRANLS